MGDRFQIQVGERHFTTTRDTLGVGSRYFGALFSGRWADVTPSDGYFLDADGDAFAHVLRFLRHGTFPVLYDETTGKHDQVMYGVILEQAKMLGIEDLQYWLENRQYFDAMQTEYIKVAESKFGCQLPPSVGLYKPTDLIVFGNGDDPDNPSVRKVKPEPVYFRTTYNHLACINHYEQEDKPKRKYVKRSHANAAVNGDGNVEDTKAGVTTALNGNTTS